jgi:large subunit ribosomal protein L10
MNPAKQLMVDEIKKQLSGSSYVFLAQFTGMNVPQVEELRKRLGVASAGYRVVKNALLARAVKDLGLALNGNLTGQTAIIYARQRDRKAPTDPVAVAKALRGYMKEFEKPQYKAGFMDGKALSAEELAALADLPTREVLLAKLLGLLNTPAQQLLYVLNAKPSEFLAVLKAYEEKQKEVETQGKS